MTFRINAAGKEPIYKALVEQADLAIHDGTIKAGEMLPSMNELAARLNISRETVKKAYGILTDRGLIVPMHGKGFFAADISERAIPQVLVIFDKLSVYKQLLFNAFSERLKDAAQTVILTHNQSVDLLEYYLDNNLDRFDYYVVMPHFPLDDATQQKALKQLSRIPHRKLILLDHLQPGFIGNFGAVYQDFENDIYNGLSQGNGALLQTRRLRVITLPSSLYGRSIRKGVERFVAQNKLPVQFLTQAPEDISPGDTFLVLNSQLDTGLVALARKIQAAGLSIGSDVRIISYNESDMNELILGGLTTVSTDFRQMGLEAADMILSRRLQIVHNPFKMIRRSTF